MRRFYLLGVLAAVVLAGCGLRPSGFDQAAWESKFYAKKETDLIFEIRNAQANYEAYLKDRLAACQLRSEVLTRDTDGILVCAKPAPAKKTEENK